MDPSHLNSEVITLLELAEALYESGKWPQAAAAYTQAIALAPDSPLLHAQRGLVLCEMGEARRAMPDFERALELDPAYGLAYYGRGWARHTLGDFAGELEDARQGLELDPGNAAMYYLRMGSAYHGLKQYRESLDAYSRSIDLDPRQPGAIYNRGLLHSEQGRHREALADFDRALELHPGWPWALDARGSLYYRLGDGDRALADYQQLVRAQPDDPAAYFKRGFLLLDKGDRAGAIEDFARTRAMAQNPQLRSLAIAQLRVLTTWWRNGLFGLLTLQPHAYREIANDRAETWRAALLVVAVGVIVAAVPLALNLTGTEIVQLRDRLVALEDMPVDQATLFAGLIGAATPLYWLALAAGVAALAGISGIRPRFGALLRATGYSSIFALPTILPLGWTDVLASTLGFWAYVIAVQAALGIGLRRALVLCLATFFAVVLLIVLAATGLFAAT